MRWSTKWKGDYSDDWHKTAGYGKTCATISVYPSRAPASLIADLKSLCYIYIWIRTRCWGKESVSLPICYRLVLRNVMVSTITAKLLLDVIEWYGSRPPPFGLLLRWVLPPPRHEYNLQVQKQWPNNYEKHHTSINWEQGSGFKWVKKEIPLKYQQKARKFTWRFSFWGIGGSEPMILCNSFSEHTGSQKRLLFIWISC